MLSTIHLQTFLAVVEAGNYSAAAERLHMSQPAVSQHIRALEAQFDDVRLFRRVGQQMVLTHAGEELLEIAREMIGLAARAEENMRALRGQVSGRVVIGCTPASAEHLLAPVLNAFCKRYSAISVTVTMAPHEALVEWLGAQQIQVLVAEEAFRRRGWESQLLGVERLVLLAPRGHELLQHDRVPPGMLRGIPLVLPRSGTPLRRTIDDGLRRRGVGTADVHAVLETDGSALMLQAVRNGMGLAFVPQSRVPRTRDIGVIDVAGLYLQQEWHALRVRERAAPRAVQELYSFLTGGDSRALLAKEGLKAQAD
jgi:DNA-binding transcriptional LysR family regulator